MDTEGMHLQVEIRKKLNLWDWKISNIRLSVGYGQQPLQWLGYVACNYVAFENGIVTSKCVPQGILVKEKLVDIERIINIECIDEEKIIVEYSGGPEAFTQCWEGRTSESDKRQRTSLIKAGYDMGDNDEMYDLINEVDALVTRVVNLIHAVVEEVDVLLHGKKVEIQFDESGLPSNIITHDLELPLQNAPIGEQLVKFQFDKEGSPIRDENGNPILLPPLESNPPKDKETYMELALTYFEEWDLGIVEKMQTFLGDMHGNASWEEFRLGREVLKGHDAQLQAILMWYSSKGSELHDKDFGLLTLEQWQLLWKDMDIPSDVLNPALTKSLWQELKDTGQMKGCYQLNAYGFYAAIMHLTLDLYTGYNSTSELSVFAEMVAHFIEDILVPKFEIKIKPRLKEFYEIDASKHQSIYKDIEDIIQKAIYTRQLAVEIDEKRINAIEDAHVETKSKLATEKASKGARPKSKPQPPPPPKNEKTKEKREKKPIVMDDKSFQVCVSEEVKNMIPYFRKWKILGEEFEPDLATLVIIYALQINLDMNEFTPLPTDELTFGMTELTRMITAASHAAYVKLPIKRVSRFSFFKTHLNESFERGGLAKPSYSNYEQKKRYLSSICLRYGGKPAPQPPIFENK